MTLSKDSMTVKALVTLMLRQAQHDRLGNVILSLSKETFAATLPF
jgi:hypothetical protein